MTTGGHDDDRVAEYVAGTMAANEIAEFEQHLLTCESCRSAVRVGATVRVALLEHRSPAAVVPKRVTGGRMALAGMMAAAAVLVAIVATRADEDTLGRVAPAPFMGAPSRPSADSITALVDRGMTAYAASDFATAVAMLDRASEDDSSAAVRFFLGVALLMEGHDQRALVALQGVSPDSPYGTESAYYAAKGLVRLQRNDSAIALLERADVGGRLTPPMRAFLDSLRRP